MPPALQEGECGNLRRVVRELSESRAKAASQRASLAERYGELQQEYHRMLRIADLSRTVSKEHLASASRTRSELRRVQLELHATRSAAAGASESAKKARVENALLRVRAAPAAVALCACVLRGLGAEGCRASPLGCPAPAPRCSPPLRPDPPHPSRARLPTRRLPARRRRRCSCWSGWTWRRRWRAR